MLCAVASDAAWKNFTTFGHVFFQTVRVFVIDVFDLVDTELADFLA